MENIKTRLKTTWIVTIALGLATCQLAIADFKFIAFGDFNGGGCDRNQRVADNIGNMAAEPGIDFFISTGDLIDGFGTTSCFATEPGTACQISGNVRSLLSPITSIPPATGRTASFYPTIGNHDDGWGSGWYPDPCNDGICDLLRETGESDDELLARYITDHSPGENVCSVEPALSDYSTYFYYAFEHQNNYFIFLKLNNDSFGMLNCNNLPGTHASCAEYCSDPALVDDANRNNKCYSVHQYDWLKEKLEFAQQQSMDHVFVFAHAPLLGSGTGHLPTSGADQYRELLESYNVDLFINGHNHAYERTFAVRGDQKDPTGTTYLTTGVAGALVDGTNGDWFTAATHKDWVQYGDSSGNTSYAAKMAGYLVVTVSTDSISGQFKSLGLGNQVVDSFVINHSGPADVIYQNGFEGDTVMTDPVPEIGGCELFPADNMWNTPIDDAPLHPLSSNYIASIDAGTTLHPDFGTQWQNSDIGIPFDIIPQGQATQPIQFLYWDESDLGDTSACDTGGSQDVGCYPIPGNPSIEGGSDKHVLLLEQESCTLWEIYKAQQDDANNWSGGSGAIWQLDQNQVRPAGFTSADAAGLAILPGLVKYDEVMVDGVINHAIRFTLRDIQKAYILPASHSDGTGGLDPDLPPMGLRLRLKADFDISGFPSAVQVILTAMKKFGIVLADSGSDMYISGSHHDLWNDEILSGINQVTAGDFEAVYTGDAIPY